MNKIDRIKSFYNDSQNYLAKKTTNIKSWCVRNKCDDFIIKICDYLEKFSQYIIPALFVLFVIQYANFMLYITNIYLLIESFILSLIVLQRGKSKFSVRLAKNVILLFIMQFRFTYSFIVQILVWALYTQINKSLNNILYDTITYITIIANNMIPQIKYIYPDIEELSKSDFYPFIDKYNKDDKEDKEEDRHQQS